VAFRRSGACGLARRAQPSNALKTAPL
jgi:hypothetical protein